MSRRKPDRSTAEKTGTPPEQSLDFRQLFDSLPFAVMVKDAESLRIVYANSQASGLLGRKSSEVVGKSLYDLLPEEMARAAEKHDREAISGNGTESEDVSVILNGGVHHLRNQKRLVQARDRKRFLVSISEDITKLRSAEIENELFFSTSLDLFVITDPSGQVIKVSPSCRQILGYSPEEFCQISPSELLHPDDLKRSQGEIERHKKNRLPLFLENRFRAKDGSHRWLSWKSIMVGNLSYAIGRDITEEKLSSVEAEENFRAITDTVPQLLWLTNSEGKFIWSNWRMSEYIGKIPQSLLSIEWKNLIHPDDYSLYLSAVEKSLQKGSYLDIQHRLKDSLSGDYRWFRCQARAIRKRGAHITKWVGTYSDIHTERSNFQKLEALHNRTAFLIQNMDGIIWAADLDGKITFYEGQSTRSVGTVAKSRLGKNIFTLIGTDAVLSQYLRKALAGESQSFQAERDGRSYQNYVTPTRDETGRINGIVGFAANITKEKMLERKLEQEQRERNQAIVQRKSTEEDSKSKSEYLATISHEIRTPLNGILGAAELLADTPLSNEQNEFIEIIKSSGDLLLSLVNDVLDYSKLEANMMKLKLRDFDLHELLRSRITAFRYSAQQKHAEIKLLLDESLPKHICADPDRISQVLVNFISNAIKFSENGTIKVEVSLLSRDSQIEFRVSDNGSGIPEEFRDRIFRPFSQAETVQSKRIGGTGLGLSICKKLVTQMGGSIDFESTLGKGSSFFFRIPLEQAKNTQASLSSADKQEGEEIDLTGTSVLIAEDTATNQILLEKILKSYGCMVTSASNGLQAVEFSKSQSFDIIFMDCHMPEMDGFEATKAIRLRDKETKQHTTIIAVTANASVEDSHKCIKAGMDDYISKPIRRKVIENTLERWRDRKGKDLDIVAWGYLLALGENDDNPGHFLNQMRSSFNSSCNTLLAQIEDNFRQGQLAQLKLNAHALKSTAASLGAAGLARLCYKLEESESLKLEQIAELIEEAKTAAKDFTRWLADKKAA